jgi:hypothetical protein
MQQLSEHRVSEHRVSSTRKLNARVFAQPGPIADARPRHRRRQPMPQSGRLGQPPASFLVECEAAILRTVATEPRLASD